MVIVYGVVKFVAYTFYSWFAMWKVREPEVEGPSFWGALGYGSLRWLLGVVIGVFLFFAIQPDSKSAVWGLYVAVYVPVRVLEWGAIGALVHANRPYQVYRPSRVFWLAWVAGGILLSFATDMVSPDFTQGRLCVGRCLC